MLPKLQIFWNWMPKNIPDRQKCVGFQKLKSLHPTFQVDGVNFSKFLTHQNIKYISELNFVIKKVKRHTDRPLCTSAKPRGRKKPVWRSSNRTQQQYRQGTNRFVVRLYRMYTVIPIFGFSECWLLAVDWRAVCVNEIVAMTDSLQCDVSLPF